MVPRCHHLLEGSAHRQPHTLHRSEMSLIIPTLRWRSVVVCSVPRAASRAVLAAAHSVILPVLEIHHPVHTVTDPSATAARRRARCCGGQRHTASTRCRLTKSAVSTPPRINRCCTSSPPVCSSTTRSTDWSPSKSASVVSLCACPAAQ